MSVAYDPLKDFQRTECRHEPDPSTVEYDRRFGRRAVCRKCGRKIIVMRPAAPKGGKVKMNKKARRKLRARRAEERRNDDG